MKENIYYIIQSILAAFQGNLLPNGYRISFFQPTFSYLLIFNTSSSIRMCCCMPH